MDDKINGELRIKQELNDTHIEDLQTLVANLDAKY